jgi:hypothetical protein
MKWLWGANGRFIPTCYLQSVVKKSRVPASMIATDNEKTDELTPSYPFFIYSVWGRGGTGG